MINIDALITKENEEFKLSDLDLEVLTFNVSAPFYELEYQTVKNRSGRVKSGGRFNKKEIEVSGYLTVKSYADYEKAKADIYAKIVDEKGYYLTQLIPISEMYEYEQPGQKQGEISTLNVQHEAQEYRYRVINTGDVAFEFNGKTPTGLLYRFEFSFETIGMPFAETKPKNIKVTNSIPYKGTAVNSQLESPWYLKLTATQAQKGDFYVQVGDKRFEHKSLTTINSGDEFQLRGVETWLNKTTINDYTNYEHFELEPSKNGQVLISTDFKGTIEVINLIEFYK